MKCITCSGSARIKTAKTGEPRCVNCFIDWFELDVHETIVRTNIFSPNDKIAVGVSGGKDSTVLAFVLTRLNQRYGYGLNLILICVDEGIKGYRDDSIKEVRKNESDLGLPLTIVSYKEIYGWTMDEIVAKIGKRNNCTFCGVFRRQALERAAMKSGATKLATGHNADDLAETVLMNVLRGDIARLQRTAAPISVGDDEMPLPRVKPLKYSYEKDIVMYAHFGKLNYFSTECIYSPNAYRNNARTFIKDLERERSRAILDLIHSGETMTVRESVQKPIASKCVNCGFLSSQKYCKACLLLYGLNNNELDIGISKKAKIPSSMTSILSPKQEKTKSVSTARDSNGGCAGNCACSNGSIDF